jgi:hypothetical protein
MPFEGNHVLTAPFPNPFRHTATFHFEAWQRDDVTVELHDLRGRRVSYLFSGVVGPGVRIPIEIGAQNLPAGLYFVRASGRAGSVSRAVHLLK